MLGFDSSSSSSQEQPAQTTSAQPISAENGKEVIGKMADSVGAAEVLTVDGDRDADSAQLCKKSRAGAADCVTIMMKSTELFAKVQAQGFFCILPTDPNRTEIECQKISDKAVDKI